MKRKSEGKQFQFDMISLLKLQVQLGMQFLRVLFCTFFPKNVGEHMDNWKMTVKNYKWLAQIPLRNLLTFCEQKRGVFFSRTDQIFWFWLDLNICRDIDSLK